MTAVRVLVVDDQPWVRVGLRELLNVQPDVEVVGEVASAEEALAWLAGHHADVVLMDVRMPGLGGVGGVRALRVRGGPPVILLTTFEEEDDMVAGLQAGAAGYLLKDVSVQQLRDAIVRVAGGERYVQPRVADVLAEAVARGHTPGVYALTDRERDVLRLLSGELTNKRIAQELKLTEGTVKVHVSNILAKLGVRDRREAIRVARHSGLA